MLWHRTGGKAGRWKWDGRGRGLCTQPEGEPVLWRRKAPSLNVLGSTPQQAAEVLQPAPGAVRGRGGLWEASWALVTGAPGFGASSVPDGLCDLGQVPSLLQI